MEIGAFLNTKIEDTGFFSAVGDTGLAPWRALLDGKTYGLQDFRVEFSHHDPQLRTGYGNWPVNPLNIEDISTTNCFWEEEKEMNKVLAVVLVIIELVTGLFLIFFVFKGLSACFSDVSEAHDLLQSKSLPFGNESLKTASDRARDELFVRNGGNIAV